ncbi:hypothetical protein ACTXT7_002828 [Hymenolepis weldensis]
MGSSQYLNRVHWLETGYAKGEEIRPLNGISKRITCHQSALLLKGLIRHFTPEIMRRIGNTRQKPLLKMQYERIRGKPA